MFNTQVRAFTANSPPRRLSINRTKQSVLNVLLVTLADLVDKTKRNSIVQSKPVFWKIGKLKSGVSLKIGLRTSVFS